MTNSIDQGERALIELFHLGLYYLLARHMSCMAGRARDYQVLNQSRPILTSRNGLGSANLIFYQSEKNRNFGFEFSRIGPKHARNHNTRTLNFLSGGYQFYKSVSYSP